MYAPIVQTLHLADPQADSTVPKWRAPRDGGKTTIKAATAISDTTKAGGAGTADYWRLRLLNMGTAGTAVAGTIADYVGGTVGWTKEVPVAFTISDGELEPGEWVAVHYDENGTVAPLNLDVVLEMQRGPATL